MSQLVVSTQPRETRNGRGGRRYGATRTETTNKRSQFIQVHTTLPIYQFIQYNIAEILKIQNVTNIRTSQNTIYDS